MTLPIRRDGDGADRDFHLLRRSFAEQLDHWPDFFTPVHSLIDAVAPRADLEETDDHYLLEVELPGISRRDVDLQLDDSRLVVTAQRVERERVGLLRHRTRATRRFALALTLPADVDGEAVTADLRHGVLSVLLPKTPHARRRRIRVRHHAPA